MKSGVEGRADQGPIDGSPGLDRREFLKSLAALGGIAALSGAGGAGCASLSPRAVAPGPPRPWRDSLLLSNVIPVDVEKGDLKPERAVLIRSGRIEALLSEADRQTAKADREIDCGGGFLIPGLVNAHCHMTLPCGIGTTLSFLRSIERQRERNAEECIRHGVTTVRDMAGPASWISELQEKISAGEIIGPRILRSMAIQVPDGYGTFFRSLGGKRTMRIVESPEESRAAVRAAVESGADHVKIFLQYRDLVLPGRPLPLLTDAMIRAIEEEAERCGIVVACHNTFVDGHRRLLDAGVPSFEHIARDAPLADEDAKRFADGGHTFVPTATVAWALVLERKGDPNWTDANVQRLAKDRTERLPGLLKEFVEEPIVEPTLGFLADWSNPEYFESWHVLPVPDPQFFTASATIGSANMRKLLDAGARMGCGNDGGVPFLFPGALFLEMMILEEAGLSAPDILRAATATNASLLRKESEIGTIQAGKRADLVVLEKNPLEAAGNVREVAAVFRDGQCLHAKAGFAEPGKASEAPTT